MRRSRPSRTEFVSFRSAIICVPKILSKNSIILQRQHSRYGAAPPRHHGLGRPALARQVPCLDGRVLLPAQLCVLWPGCPCSLHSGRSLTAWRYFTGRDISLLYYAGVGVAWSLTAIILDYPFIVLRFGAFQYYTPDVLLYYALMFFIPVGVGLYRERTGTAAGSV